MASTQRPYALVDVRWLPLPASLRYPTTEAFGLTGYREEDGPSGLFSVYVRTLGGRPGVGVVQCAKLYALVDAMRPRLPEIGKKFMLTAGATVVAECSTRGRGEEEE
jgi:hypothetical protein